MRIIVPIATRGHPLRLSAVLYSLTTLASGKHDIEYVVRVDDDDEETQKYVADLAHAYPIEVIFEPRPIGLGQSWNDCVRDREWDAAVIVADKHLCLTPGWDDVVARSIAEVPALRWTLLKEPLETLLILHRRWYDAVGNLLPEWFPFWFSERWVFEVHHLAFGAGIPRSTDLVMTEPVGKTQNLRDLEFWFDFFAHTRTLRIVEARKIADAFGRTMPQINPIVAEMRRSDEWQIPRIQGYYETRGGSETPPTREYREAKRRAQAWLDMNIPAMEEAHV